MLLAVFGIPLLDSQLAAIVQASAKPQPNPASSPYDVLNLVNQLRANKGLAPLKANAELMNAAQKHSEYQASVRSITHYGPGGNSVKDRAAAAGYGGGAAFFVVENIYGGTNATAQNAVTWWQGDAPHLNTMLGAQYTDAGAGVATDGTIVYYTLDVGYISGAPGTGGTGAATPQTGASTPVTFNPVQVATPMPDGSIVHTVQSGQTLWSIAAIYKVDLQELLRLNQLTQNTLIYVGQKILIKGPDAPASPTQRPTLTPTRTLKPTLIPRYTATEVGQALAVLEQPVVSSDNKSQNDQTADAMPGVDLVLVAIGALVGGGLILAVVGSLLTGRKTGK